MQETWNERYIGTCCWNQVLYCDLGRRYFSIIKARRVHVTFKFLISGRFDLHCAAFKCSRCDGVMNAELEDYIGSGYWPGNPKTLGIFFTTSFLKLYFHLKNYLPGSSEYGLLKALGAFSADAGRVFFKKPV